MTPMRVTQEVSESPKVSLERWGCLGSRSLHVASTGPSTCEGSEGDAKIFGIPGGLCRTGGSCHSLSLEEQNQKGEDLGR